MEIFHIYPENDLKPHDINGNTCPCNPETQACENGILVVHNSWDGREIRERLVQDLKDNGVPN